MSFLKSLAGIFVGKIVLRAQLIPIGELGGLKYIWAKLFYSQKEIDRLNNLWNDFVIKNAAHEKSNPELSVNVKRELIPRPDGTKVDTIELSAKNKNPTQYVIYGWGRADCYEFYLSRMASDALNLNKVIVSFNYRNVAHSKGQVYHEQDLINDYAFQVQRLLDKGVKPENITCYGHSLCGAIATFSLEDFINKQKMKELKFANDRSFADLVETSVRLYFKRPTSRARIVNVGTIALFTIALSTLALLNVITLSSFAMLWVLSTLSVRWQLTHQFYDKTVGNLLQEIMIRTMRHGEWELKAAQVYDQIPLENKIHTVIKKPKTPDSKFLGKRHVVGEKAVDKVILYEYALHPHLPNFHQEKNALKQALSLALKNNELDKVSELQARLLEMSNIKISGGDHMADPKEFIMWYKLQSAQNPITLQQRLYDFFEPNADHLHTAKAKTYKSF